MPLHNTSQSLEFIKRPGQELGQKINNIDQQNDKQRATNRLWLYNSCHV